MSWLASVSSQELHLSAVTIGEVQGGIEITRRRDADKAAELERWLELIIRTMKIIDMDAGCFRTWARMMRGKSDALLMDAMIAATVNRHGLILVTRNVKDFSSFAVPTFNPFKAP